MQAELNILFEKLSLESLQDEKDAQKAFLTAVAHYAEQELQDTEIELQIRQCEKLLNNSNIVQEIDSGTPNTQQLLELAQASPSSLKLQGTRPILLRTIHNRKKVSECLPEKLTKCCLKQHKLRSDLSVLEVRQYWRVNCTPTLHKARLRRHITVNIAFLIHPFVEHISK
jgi:hypothetical protein